MGTAVDSLKDWFEIKLDSAQQEEVLNFLYGGKILLQKGEYIGPYPNLVTKGLHCGPAPLASSLGQYAPRICPACGRPL